MERVAKASAWTAENRRVATVALLALLAAGAAGFIYLNYRADIQERAAVRLDEIRMSSRGAPLPQLRSELATYVRQFGATPQGDEARLLLAEMELQRDSVANAIRLLEPVVDLREDPIGYNAGWMMAVAEEQRGNLEAAERWYERLADAARHGFQRRRARAALARLHTYAGEYAAAEAIYEELAAEETAAADAQFYAVKLGEVRARADAELPPPEVPTLDVPAPERPAATGAPEPADTGEAAADDAGQPADATEEPVEESAEPEAGAPADPPGAREDR